MTKAEVEAMVAYHCGADVPGAEKPRVTELLASWLSMRARLEEAEALIRRGIGGTPDAWDKDARAHLSKYQEASG